MNLIHMYAQFWWSLGQYWHTVGLAWYKFLNDEVKNVDWSGNEGVE